MRAPGGAQQPGFCDHGWPTSDRPSSTRLSCCDSSDGKETMHGGGVVTLSSAGAGDGYSSEITFTVVMSCLMAASGGLIFGYDISITGLC